MKLLKMPLLVLVRVLKYFDEDTVVNMPLFFTRVKSLMNLCKRTPECHLIVSFTTFTVDVVPFWKYTVSESPPNGAASNTKGKQWFDGEKMQSELPIVRKGGDVKVYCRDKMNGVFKIMLEVVARLKVKAVNYIYLTPECPIMEVFDKLTVEKVTVENLVVAGKDEDGQATRQVFLSPFLKKVTGSIRFVVDVGDSFELPDSPVAINIPKLYVVGGGWWFKMKHLMVFEKAVHVNLRDSYITTEEVRDYFIKWWNKERENLSVLKISGPVEGYTRIEVARVISEVPENQKGVVMDREGPRANVFRDDRVKAEMRAYNNWFECNIRRT